jgi:hypothetical protein
VAAQHALAAAGTAAEQLVQPCRQRLRQLLQHIMTQLRRHYCCFVSEQQLLQLHCLRQDMSRSVLVALARAAPSNPLPAFTLCSPNLRVQT